MARRRLPLRDWPMGATSRRTVIELLANPAPLPARELVARSGFRSATVHEILRPMSRLDLLDPDAGPGHRLRGAELDVEFEVGRRLEAGRPVGEAVAVGLRWIVAALADRPTGEPAVDRPPRPARPARVEPPELVQARRSLAIARRRVNALQAEVERLESENDRHPG